MALSRVPRASRCHGREGGEASTRVHDVDVMYLSSRELALFRWLCVQVQVPRTVRHKGRTDRHQGNESKAELWGLVLTDGLGAGHPHDAVQDAI